MRKTTKILSLLLTVLLLLSACSNAQSGSDGAVDKVTNATDSTSDIVHETLANTTGADNVEGNDETDSTEIPSTTVNTDETESTSTTVNTEPTSSKKPTEGITTMTPTVTTAPVTTTPATTPPSTTEPPATTAPTPSATLTVSQTTATITVGETYQVKYSYTGSTTNLTWTSRNTFVATVNSGGVVTAIAEGTAHIMVSDGSSTKKCVVTVKPATSAKATEIILRVQNGPLYDGITKYAGDHLWFVGYTKPNDANKDITVTSSNSSVVSISSGSSGGITNGVGFTLNFKSAGSATITLKSGDGAVTESYTINVKSGYSFNPGSGQLTPEQFASYATQVMVANGFTETSCGSWRLLTLSASDLTFATAVDIAEAKIHEWWPNGCRYCQITYEGQNEDGNYMFYTRWG